MKKIAVFADVQNLYYTVRQAHGCHFNYAALWADISQRGQITHPRQPQYARLAQRLHVHQRLLRLEADVGVARIIFPCTL